MKLALKYRKKICYGPKACPIYLTSPWLRDPSTRFETRISSLISSNFTALDLICCLSSRLAFSTITNDVLSVLHLNSIIHVIYSLTCDCESKYTGKNYATAGGKHQATYSSGTYERGRDFTEGATCS